MMGPAELRKEAADAGIRETGQYVEWLEQKILDLLGDER